METWVKAALDYIPRWLDYQMRESEQPGCAVAVAHKGRVVLEQAFGHANAIKKRPLTPQHRFRVASHSKSFTAAGILRLRERDKLRLDDPVARYVDGLHADVGAATVGQLLSHSAGLIRDGFDAGQWQDRRPFANAQELRAVLAEPPVLGTSERFKYSNHGFGLLGLVIESVTGEPYGDWIAREVVARAKLEQTYPDAPPPKGVPFVSGHSSKLPLGRRVVVPGDNPTQALAPATGFVSTAGDLARFFGSLDPAARRSPLSPASRREMVRPHWRDNDGSAQSFYGLGIMCGELGGWPWFGHGGAFQSTLSRSIVLPGRDLAVSLLTNAIDGWAPTWSEGVVRILQAFAKHGAPLAKTAKWSGRWWSLWRALDLVPMRDHVAIANPGLFNPFQEADEIEVSGRDRGWVRRGGGYTQHGEAVRLTRTKAGRPRALWVGGVELVTEARMAAEMKRRYGR